jgi:4'-phosphopantetheinyl transferase
MAIAHPLPDSPRVTLAKQKVHIWRVFLDQSDEWIQQLAGTLSPDERARADTFYFERDRRRFIVSRGFLRRILSSYLETGPDRLQFCYGKYGKPALAGQCGVQSLRFNLSHSHEFAAYAVAFEREVGIDIEYMRSIAEMEQLVERFFCPGEIAAFYAFHADERREAFFRGWTRKEAYLKATGTGLSQVPNQVEVTLCRAPARLLKIAGQVHKSLCWSLRDLELAPGYACALSAAGGGYQIEFMS